MSLIKEQEIIENFRLISGKYVFIKYITIDDIYLNNNYEFFHAWRHKSNKYMRKKFNKEDLEEDKKKYFTGFSRHGKVIRIGAFFNQKIIGHCGLRIISERARLRSIGRWEVSIHYAFQNQGLGIRLLRIIEQIAIEKGLRKLQTEYIDENKKAEYIYLHKLDYKIKERKKNGALIGDNHYSDVILIEKILDD